MRGFCLEVSGDFACFTRPEMKVERVSYDVITPSAARSLFEAILWKPAIRWHISKIEVLNPIPDAPPATDEQIDSVARSLEDNPQVDSVEFLDEVATFEEFQRLFEDQPDFVSAIKPEELPQSFRVKPSSTASGTAAGLCGAAGWA